MLLMEAHTNKEKGFLGEDIALEYLTQKGYKVLKRNFKFGNKGELDIVAVDKSCIVFVEVKARTAKNNFGDPLYSITPIKQRNLRRAAEGYLYVNKITDKDCRFDIVIVDLQGENPKVEHLINAF